MLHTDSDGQALLKSVEMLKAAAVRSVSNREEGCDDYSFLPLNNDFFKYFIGGKMESNIGSKRTRDRQEAQKKS